MAARHAFSIAAFLALFGGRAHSFAPKPSNQQTRLVQLSKCTNLSVSPRIISRSNRFPVWNNTPVAINMVSDDTEDLLEAASRLRKEAEELEMAVRGNKSSDASSDKKPVSLQTKFTSFEDSSWTISYRFASDALPQGDDDDEEEDVKVTYYSGKVKIVLTADGYTNMIDDEENSSSSKLSFEKFWGWDEETSREDDLQYILFSADVMLPTSDPNFEKKPTRFYFQSQVDRDSRTGEISLRDGTVTVKKDIEPPGGFWGVFNAGGILAQFRYCGNFLMKPN